MQDASRTDFWNLTMISISWVSTNFLFFGSFFFVKYLPGDFYLNTILASLSILSFLVMTPLSKIISSRMMLSGTFAIALILMIVMLWV